MDISRRKFLLGAGATALAAPGLGGLMLEQKGVEYQFARRNSLWSDELSAQPPLASLQGDRKVDVAIVGGGYTGLSCAYYLKQFRPDWTVIVLESHQIGSGASSRNSGVVSARQVGISDLEMPQRGLNRLREFIAKEEISCDFTAASTLMMVASGGRMPDLAPGERWIPGPELSEKISSRYYGGAVDTPDNFTIHPAKLVAGHARAATRVGVELFERSPVLSITDGKVAKLNTPQGTVLADKVLIATNAYTPRLGYYQSAMYPIHQYSLATGKLSSAEIASLGLDRWSLRFEKNILPVTFSLTPSGHFFVRMVLGYASFNSCQWPDLNAAKQLARKLFVQRYPSIRHMDLSHGWHGVTGHTLMMRPLVGAYGQGTIHVSAAYNGLGIMPAHNSGYLSACQITGQVDDDYKILTNASSKIPMPGDFYRSLMLKPFMQMMTPV